MYAIYLFMYFFHFIFYRSLCFQCLQTPTLSKYCLLSDHFVLAGDESEDDTSEVSGRQTKASTKT